MAQSSAFARIQSPSSILMFKQCPRKYYYRYIAKLPTSDSIHLLRGSIVHKVLEDVWDVDISAIPEESFPITIRMILQEMLRKEWGKHTERFGTLGLSDDSLAQYYAETRTMMNNYFQYLMDKMREHEHLSHKEAFAHIKPVREVELKSLQRGVMGYADVIAREGDKVVVLDYKTSKHPEITDDYHLQLSIYSMLYEERDRLPDEVGIFFLKHGIEKRVQVTRDMVELADREVRFIHEQTQSKDIRDYSKKPSGLCKWSTGKCDFYDTCYGKSTLADFDEDLVQIGK